MSSSTSVVGGLRRAEHTGENRCWPCTVLNVGLAALASAIVGLVWLPAGIAVLAVSLLGIYLRGYLVPGTPTVTQRYLPDRVLAAFHGTESAPAEAAADDGWESVKKREYEAANRVDPEAFLLEAEAVRERGADLAFTDAFAKRVRRNLDEIDEQGVDAATVAPAFGADPGDVEWVERDYPAVRVDARIRKWPSTAALHHDLAAHRALAATADGWDAVPIEQRLGILQSLRSFSETCPACSGPIGHDRELVESCCSSGEVVTVSCEDCGARLLEIPADTVDGVDGDPVS